MKFYFEIWVEIEFAIYESKIPQKGISEFKT